jgi:hypothetical protein
MKDPHLGALDTIALVLRGTMEAGIVGGLVFWGLRAGSSPLVRVVLAISAPVIVFGFWATVDFRWLGRSAEAMRLVQELAVAALVAVALFAVGSPVLGWSLAAVSVSHHVFARLAADRLRMRHAPRPRLR